MSTEPKLLSAEQINQAIKAIRANVIGTLAAEAEIRDHIRALETRHAADQQTIEELQEKLKDALANTRMKMFVWTDLVSFVAVAHEHSVDAARKAMLVEMGASGDGSCPERDKARRIVLNQTPAIYLGSNAEFMLSDSAAVRENEAALEIVEKDRLKLRSDTVSARARITELEGVVEGARAALEAFADPLNWNTVRGVISDYACAWCGPEGPYAPDAFAHKAIESLSEPPAWVRAAQEVVKNSVRIRNSTVEEIVLRKGPGLSAALDALVASAPAEWKETK